MKVELSDFIAHISDVHIRYGSRHEEYKIVFQRVIDDLKNKDVRRIVLTGDLFHIKITLSPKALSLAGWFLKELSKIAPVDIILGNHDLNLQSLDQGNAVEPIVEMINDGHIVERGSKKIPEHIGDGNGIFFYLYSGFYEVDDEIIYGVYSCLDNEILRLTQKEKDKKYIALYHGPVYGCLGNNGYELMGENLMNLSVFNNFDIVMLGDIHEHQSFSPVNSEIESIAYSGSLVQQDFSESLEKGYLIWDLSTQTFEMQYIENDYGFSSLHISKGELPEERILDLKMSKNPKKTKVNVVWEDFHENYSVEKDKQIERLVKTNFGCENISVDFKQISKEEELNALDIDDDIDYSDIDEFETLLREFVQNSEYDNEDEVIELAQNIDKELNYNTQKGKKWHLNKMVVWNLFSFPDKEIEFDFDAMKGITGIFGKNFNGKSNIIRVLVWILYKKILGGGDSHRLVNMYTNSDTAGGRIYITIDSEKYYIERTVKVRIKKDGTPDVSYGIEYKKLVGDKWKNVDSEKAATEKAEKSNIIIESLGTFEDFTKVVLQSQSGEGNYLNMSQQPKNDLINKYLGLEIFRDRYDYAKKVYNDITAKQKLLGDSKTYEDSIISEEEKIKSNSEIIKQCESERTIIESNIDKYDNQILELTKKIVKVEETKYNTVDSANKAILTYEENNKKTSDKISELEGFLKSNFKKELPQNLSESTFSLENKIKTEKNKFDKEKAEYVQIEEWLKNNPKKEEKDSELISKNILEIEQALSKLNDKLQISKGKKCPTCGNVEQAANPDEEKKCLSDIERGKKVLSDKKEELRLSKEILTHNNTYDKQEIKLGQLKNSLQSSKNNLEQLKKDLELAKTVEEIKVHNKNIEQKTNELDSFRKQIIDGENTINEIKKEIKILENNKESILNNEKINQDIKNIDHEKKAQKLALIHLNDKTIQLKSDINISNNNIESYKDTLDKINKTKEAYSKYTIYLQAVHRDGIPAKIIKKKLPIINYKINSILKNLVDFKIELTIKDNGDIKEQFYFNSIDVDALPMSMASGAQTFVGSVAIRDALHFVSSLTKPSLCIIDEGFGSLDDELTIAMESVFSYLKNKYKNTWIITHKNEIKDFVDSIIQVSKTKEGLTEEQIKDNPKAGISIFDIQN
jgi:DNA repair exonuclease SbcCD ATPase subunit